MSARQQNKAVCPIVKSERRSLLVGSPERT
jgi:hypothetical protein